VCHYEKAVLPALFVSRKTEKTEKTRKTNSIEMDIIEFCSEEMHVWFGGREGHTYHPLQK